MIPVIGKFVLSPMNAKAPDVEGVLRDFRDCLNTFDEWAERFWSGSSLEVEQVFKVGEEVSLVAPASSKKPNRTVAVCKAQGALTLVHMFESTRFVPIGNTPVMLQAIAPDGSPMGAPIHHTIGPSGILEIKDCTRDQHYQITFYPNVSKDHVKALYASYQSVIAGLEGRLRDEWKTTFKPQWRRFANTAPLERSAMQAVAFSTGIGKALYNLWDNFTQLYELLADLKANSEKLLQYITQAELDELLKLGKDAIAHGLLVLSDEPLLFIYLSAMVAWIRMLPPPQMYELLGEITGEVLINLFLIWATRGMGVQIRLGAQVLGHIKSGRVRKWLEMLADQLAEPRLEQHVEAAKPLLVGSPTIPIRTIPDAPLKAGNQVVSNPVPVIRDKAQRTVLVRQEPVDDAPVVAKNPAGDAAAASDKTATNGCPVSMVTGEELLTLTDGALDGILPFEWTRLYRTSAVEVDCGLGFGWSHSLAHRLSVSGDSVVWTDHENRSTTLPLPSASRPATTNSLAEAAIYLGALPDELVLAQASRFYHFRDGVLTAISDAYDNRLRIFRNYLGQIERLDNGVGRSLFLRYASGRIVAVDYQVERAVDDGPFVWVTEQNVVSYAYDGAGRLVSATNAVGESEVYRYDNQHVILERGLAGGASFFWEWERSGKAARCVRHWASFSQMDTRYVWDDNGQVTVHNADGSQEVYVHDQRARLVQRVDPDGAEHFKSYDEKGRLTVEQDPLGAITAYQYDEAGRLVALFPGDDEPTSYEHENGFVRVVRRGEAVWKYERNDQGDVTRRTDPDGNATDYSYNKYGQLVGVWYQDHSCQKLVWNERGQLLEEQLPNGGIKRYRYDDLGRQVAREDEHGALTQYQWDAAGRLLKVTQPDGATREYSYNPYGKITSDRDELGNITRYEYADGLHLISRRINADGTQVKYRYDNVRLLLTEIENEVGETYRLQYHSNGLIQQETGFDGQRTAYVYDLNGNLQEKTEHGDDGSQLVTRYERDHAGRLVRKTLPDGNIVDYAYDRQGNLLSVDDGHWALAYEYDPQNRLTAEHQGWGTLRYGYDACGQLKNLRLPDNNRLVFNHSKGGQLEKVELNGRTLTAHRFDTGREHQRGQGSLLSSYQYDEQGRLFNHGLCDVEGAIYQRQYHYDKSGNLTRLIDTRKGESHYHYDPLSRLTRVHHSQGEQERFGPKETKPYYYQLDHLGTPQELTAPNGEVVWSAHYRAYGEITRLDANKIDNPLRFQGQYFDPESRLHYNRHRYYNPDIGRYLTPDPVKLAGGINAYQYVPNPTGWVDPLGLSANCPPKGKYPSACKTWNEPEAPDISRKGAFRGAKRDAGIPMSQSPDMVVDPDTGKTKQYAIEKMTDKNEKRILDDNGMPIDTRVYQFTRSNGSKILIQDHSAGHKFGRVDSIGDHSSHFNLRPIDKLRKGYIEGAKKHYPFRK